MYRERERGREMFLQRTQGPSQANAAETFVVFCWRGRDWHGKRRSLLSSNNSYSMNSSNNSYSINSSNNSNSIL